jgi:hypothetical protein
VAGRLRDESHQRVTGDGFAGTGFADEAERLAFFQRKTDAVDRAIYPAASVEISAEIGDVEQRHGGEVEAGSEAVCGNVKVSASDPQKS